MSQTETKQKYKTLVVYTVGMRKIMNAAVRTRVPADQLTADDVFNDIFTALKEEECTENIAILNLIKLSDKED